MPDSPSTKKQRQFHVLRLLEEDAELVKGLASDDQTRHDALLALVPIVNTLDFSPHSPPKRIPIRVGFPTELKKALEEAQERSGRSMVQIFLAAARTYVDRRNSTDQSDSQDTASH